MCVRRACGLQKTDQYIGKDTKDTKVYTYAYTNHSFQCLYSVIVIYWVVLMKKKYISFMNF